MKKFIIEVTVKEEWLRKWSLKDPESEESTKDGLQIWLEIQTAGTGITIDSVHETE